ncbi:MAG: hypothetical protein LV468_03020 [Candidatus Nitrosotenuis sp.]|nr:hypothetical protein [Candidatus Nitrosotenuis sp.]
MNLIQTNDDYIQELCHIWAHNFLEECARLAKEKPYMNNISLERLAASITTKAMYYDQVEELPRYKRSNFWRIGME